MAVGFTTVQSDGRVVDVDDLLVRRDIFAQGQLWAWGYNLNGQVGDNTTSNRSSPVTTAGAGITWKQAAAGGATIAAVKTDGTLWTWGLGSLGQIGDSSTATRSSPVTTAGGGTTWKQAACGYRHVAAVKTDGTLWAWGQNSVGELGDGTVSNRSSPVTTSGGGTNWRSVACGYRFTAAIKTDGTLWTCGYNSQGQLGDGTTSSRSSPVTTSGGGTTWKQVACGYKHTAAIKTDGTLWMWGFNTSGQLGTNNTSIYSSPVTTIAGDTTWQLVACGVNHTMAIKTDGTLWTWGSNNRGQLGDSTTSNRSSAVTTTGGGTNWKQAAGGGACTVAVKTDGILWTWGANTQGQLGNNTTSSRSSPGTTVSTNNTWKQIVATGTVAGNNDATAALNDLSL